MSETPVVSVAHVSDLTTAQDLLDWVLSEPLRSRNQRRNAAGAIRWIGRVDGTPLALIPLEVRYLVDVRVALIRRHGLLTRTRRASIITLLNQVLRRAGLSSSRIRRRGITRHDWTVLIDSLQDSRDRFSLTSLGKFCSRQGIAPRSLTLAVWTSYVEETIGDASARGARIALQRTRKVSNAARLKIRGWPLPELPGLSTSRTCSIARDNLPAAFWHDVGIYVGQSGDACLASVRSVRHKQLAASTLRRYASVIWRTASIQVRLGRTSDEISSLKELLDLQWLEKTMDWLLCRAGDAGRRDHLNMAATWVSIADRHVRLPVEALERIRRMARRR